LAYRGGLAVYFLEVRYVQVSTALDGSKTTFVPLTAGIRIGGP